MSDAEASPNETTADEATSGRIRDRVTLAGIANVVGLLVLIAVVVPFVIYAFPQVVGASESYVVLSGSMEPAMSPGDAIIVEDVSPGEVAEGDVITFSRESEARPTTHRVEGVVSEGEGTLFVTKGDANEEADQEHVQPSQIEGRVMTVGGFLFVIPYIGYILEFAKTQSGFVLLFVLPIGLFLANEVYTFARGGSGQETAAEASDGSQEPTGDATADTGTSTAGVDPDAVDSELGAVDGVGEIDGAAGVGSATAASEGTGSADTFSLDPSEFRLGVLVMAVFAGYSVWVAYTLTEPWSVGSAAAVVMATVMFGSLYVFGEPTEPDDGEESPEGSDMQTAHADSAAEPGADTAVAPDEERGDAPATDPVDAPATDPVDAPATDPAEASATTGVVEGDGAITDTDGVEGQTDADPAGTTATDPSGSTTRTDAALRSDVGAGADGDRAVSRPSWIDADGQHPTRTVATNPSVGTWTVDETGGPARATDAGQDADGGDRQRDADVTRSGGETDD